MADYTTPSGAGQLMVRDLGGAVEFWVYTPYRLFWNNLRFNVDANGTTTYFSINYNGQGLWIKVGQINISNSQSINYRLLDRTNTTSIGGPTTMSVFIERGRVPDAPGAPRILGSGTDYIDVQWVGGGDGGRPIDIRQIGWGKNPGGAERYDWIGDTHRFGSLEKGVMYYFWAQAHNDKGWGPWSGRSNMYTIREPDATNPQGVSEVGQTSFRYRFTGNWDGGAPIIEWQIGWGTNPNTPSTIIGSGGDSKISGLEPATTYYVWSRGRNSVGAGPWSARTQVRTIAGAYITYQYVPREAIPYMKVNGVWRLLEPWVKRAGEWKESR